MRSSAGVGTIMGYWHKMTARCSKCHKSRDKVYEVREGPATGIFCGRFCYEDAVKEQEGGDSED